ncbi:2-oxo-3-hexenedioate decarboxylase [Rhodoblastus acidophilus]|uniref:2-oxo-3-hexenedioate decarboxylase n=1 Tax=Candidatus Rhodoblastus alkanivorans TaxID=2954117 RepID=A0ABS9Z3V7_9HYPH|nr:2-oxo-3-hexenedioate decarboxylase [Candidatus Rhodoblastus alkanivorans]MCI4679981.1 2-oxo-3-hexenedioate decarboxylase [Candidatus Rhodoblastus alkanivorans]MCI4682364.1 2-oxo-3-hexenedioate decarboxylase [Candidatus Rhodoblastus alkanivorans]MDI4639667.1 2-oxo-3-hexenedioate decarboxylase [Rhodoblastus acidophilus]
MALDKDAVGALAEYLETAELDARAVPQISLQHPGITEDDGYAIQHAIRRRKEARGVRIVGIKAGLTSRAKMKQVGVDRPSYGFLADYFAVNDGARIPIEQLIHPRVEPEIAFVLDKPLEGPGCHIGAVLAATDFVLPALEVIDSRYENFKFDFPSVVADNSSSSRFVLGGRCRPLEDLDLRTIGLVLEKNGAPFAFGAGAAVLGHPAAAVAMVVNLLARRGEGLPAGALVMTGGATEAVSVAAGDFVQLRAQNLGSVSVGFA